jgi:hypothetical protein
MEETTLPDHSVASAGIILGGLDGSVYKMKVDGSLAWIHQTNGQVCRLYRILSHLT